MASRGPAARPRYQSLDHWRGVACLAVIVFHSRYFAEIGVGPGGGPSEDVARVVLRAISLMWVGVPMFFVISGYCISATIDSHRRRGDDQGTFFRRRFRRIYPTYWAAVLLAIPMVAILDTEAFGMLYSKGPNPIGPPRSMSPSQWLGNLTLTESWRYHLGGDPRRYFLVHSWTLCYEEQFYVVSGILMRIAPRRFFAAAAAVTVAVSLVVPIAPIFGWSIDGLFYDGRWRMFAAGILVYWKVNHADSRGASWSYAALAAGLLWFAREPAKLREYFPNPEQAHVAAFAFAALLCALHPVDGRLASARALRPLAACGTMCYSLYLLHWPIVRALSCACFLAGVRGRWPTLLVTIPACLAVTVLATRPFYRLVERRFLNPPAVPRGPSPSVSPSTGPMPDRPSAGGRPFGVG